jgi:hypothetical protein
MPVDEAVDKAKLAVEAVEKAAAAAAAAVEDWFLFSTRSAAWGGSQRPQYAWQMLSTISSPQRFAKSISQLPGYESRQV